MSCEAEDDCATAGDAGAIEQHGIGTEEDEGDGGDDRGQGGDEGVVAGKAEGGQSGEQALALVLRPAIHGSTTTTVNRFPCRCAFTSTCSTTWDDA